MWLWLKQPQRRSPGNCRRATVDVERAKDGRQVALDRAIADAQVVPDLCVAFPCRHQPQDIELPVGERHATPVPLSWTALTGKDEGWGAGKSADCSAA